MKTRTLDVVMAEIEKLRAEAERIKSHERAAVIARMKEAIKTYAIDLTELATVKPKRKAAPAPKRKPSRPYAKRKGQPSGYERGATYSDGTRIWRGFSRPPKWLIEHAAGRPLSEFKVKEA